MLTLYNFWARIKIVVVVCCCCLFPFVLQKLKCGNGLQYYIFEESLDFLSHPPKNICARTKVFSQILAQF